MASADFMQQALNFVIIGIVIVIILNILNPLMSSSNIGVSNLFVDLCSQEDGVEVLQNIQYNPQTSLIQFMLPETGLTSQDMSMDYPRETYDILTALYDYNNDNLRDEVGKYQGLTSERKNPDFLEACAGQPCFCVVRTDMNYITYEDLELTACFPRLYSYEPAYDKFNTKFEEINENNPDDSEKEVFEATIKATLEYLHDNDNSAEATEIIECYHLFKDWNINSYSVDYNYDYKGVPGKYLLTINTKSGNVLEENEAAFENAITNFYDLTEAGLFNEVTQCTVLPDENNCYDPHISSDTAGQKGVFLGIAGSKQGAKSSISIDALIFQLGEEGKNIETRIGS